MSRYNDFDLDLQEIKTGTTFNIVTTRTDICKASYDIGVCYTVGFGCQTIKEDCGTISLSFCC